MNLVFATQNRSKLLEITHLLQSAYRFNKTQPNLLASEKIAEESLESADYYHLLDLSELGCFEELPETHDNLEENALEKAMYVFQKYKMSCFADDSGLEIDALGGKPGVYSARYAGEAKSSEANMDKVLEDLKNIENRKAQFRTVIALVIEGKAFFFEGIVKGQILKEKIGSSGFGYDPIFQPDGYHLSFAEMSLSEKAEISHRSLAVKKLIHFLTSTPDVSMGSQLT